MKEATHGKSEPKAVRRGVPWWLWVVAVSFLLYFGFVLYLDFAGPFLGVLAGFAHGNVVVAEVYRHSPGDAAGFQPGDRILRADGQLIVSDVDWIAILVNLKVGEPISFEIQRDSQRLNLVVTPARTRRLFAGTGRANPLMFVLFRLGQSIMLGLACFVAFARPRSGAALLGASFLGMLSIYNPPGILAGYTAVARELPPIPLLWIPVLGTATMAPLLFTFCAVFPRKLIRTRWIWALLWIPPLVWLFPVVRFDYRVMWDPHHATGLFPEWASVAVGITWLGYFVAGPVAMAVNYKRLRDTNERRRVRVLVFGFVVGVFALLPLGLILSHPAVASSNRS